MDIYAYITRDHRRITGLIDELLSINLQAVQRRLFEQLKRELLMHAGAKEDTFYRTVEDAVRRQDGVAEDISRARQEHNEIRSLLDHLTDESMTSPKWLVMFGELKHAVEHHIEAEEGTVFGRAKTLISPLDAHHLALRMEALKQQLRAGHVAPVE